MFGKKKKELGSFSTNEQFSEDEILNVPDMVNQAFNQPTQNTMQGQIPNVRKSVPPIMPNLQNMNVQPVQQQYNQQMQHQMNQPMNNVIHQPVAQPVAPTALIVGVEVQENGDYIYKVITNYPLSIGYCNLQQ